MEWFLTSGYWNALNVSFTSPDLGCAMITSSPTDIDLKLIRLAYEVAAGESSCAKCGAPVRQRLRLVTWYAEQSPTWRVVVTTHCRGWRRHRYTAVVTEASNTLQFGRLLPSSRLELGR